MDSTCRTKTVQSLTKDIEKNHILLTHKLQRKEGQWNRRQKSELIDSLLRGYPINPTYGVKEEKNIYIIDGVQRLSTIRDYLANGFPLVQDLEPVIINGEVKEIAGKRFKKLDEDTREALTASELQLYEMTDCTEKDVREMFRRQNAGKALNNMQLRTTIESDEMAEAIHSLTSHPLFDKLFTKTQRKRDMDKDAVIQALMLIETDDEHDYAFFRSKNINNFILMYQENINYGKIATLKQSLDNLDGNLGKLKINTASIPMVIYAAYSVIKENKPFDKLAEAIQNFVDNYDTNAVYKQFCQSGTRSSENVKGRFNYWREIVSGL